MKRSTEEWITGIIIGLILSLLLAVKALGAPLTQEDAELIARTVQAESGNQDFKGKRLVAAVVLNRIESEDFPNTATEVLSQPKQFSTYTALRSTEATYLDRLAVSMEIKERSDAEIMFFRAGRYGCGIPAYQHGDHYFSK